MVNKMSTHDLAITGDFESIFKEVYKEAKYEYITAIGLYMIMTVDANKYAQDFFAKCDNNKTKRKGVELLNSIIFAKAYNPHNYEANNKKEG